MSFPNIRGPFDLGANTDPHEALPLFWVDHAPSIAHFQLVLMVLRDLFYHLNDFTSARYSFYFVLQFKILLHQFAFLPLRIFGLSLFVVYLIIQSHNLVLLVINGFLIFLMLDHDRIELLL